MVEIIEIDGKRFLNRRSIDFPEQMMLEDDGTGSYMLQFPKDFKCQKEMKEAHLSDKNYLLSCAAGRMELLRKRIVKYYSDPEKEVQNATHYSKYMSIHACPILVHGDVYSSIVDFLQKRGFKNRSLILKNANSIRKSIIHQERWNNYEIKDARVFSDQPGTSNEIYHENEDENDQDVVPGKRYTVDVYDAKTNIFVKSFRSMSDCYRFYNISRYKFDDAVKNKTPINGVIFQYRVKKKSK